MVRWETCLVIALCAVATVYAMYAQAQVPIRNPAARFSEIEINMRVATLRYLCLSIAADIHSAQASDAISNVLNDVLKLRCTVSENMARGTAFTSECD